MINYDDLEMAMEFVSSGEEFGSFAYIDEDSGQIYYVSDMVDEEYPEDVEENDKYKLVPHKRELGLGKSLAIAFSEEYLPSMVGAIQRVFSSKGAYSTFKEILEDNSLLEKWYEYEKEATQRALVQWCNERGLEISI